MHHGEDVWCVCELQVGHQKVQLISLLPTGHRENHKDDDDCKFEQGSPGTLVSPLSIVLTTY